MQTGAHPGMTVQMEHTTCEDLLTDDAAVLSEFDLILLFSLVSELYIYIILFKRDVKMFVRIVQQMKRIDFEKYLVDIKQDDSMRIMSIDYVIC